MDWSNDATDVQGVWNDFEKKLIEVVDELVPMSEFKNNFLLKPPNQLINNKKNLRKRLLKALRRNPTLEMKSRIKNLNSEIKTHFYSEKRSNVRKNLVPGNSKSLWKAVNSAHDIGTAHLPSNMTLGNVKKMSCNYNLTYELQPFC